MYGKKMRILTACIAVMCAACTGRSETGTPEKVERTHFVIYHNNRRTADNLGWKAEAHYKRIIRHFGTPRFNPWGKTQKCPIYLFSSKEEYLMVTGAPVWSSGIAQYKPFRFASYEGAPLLIECTLPHEMTHMLFHEFMEGEEIPLWLNEGMAQFEEQDNKATYRRKRFLKKCVSENRHIPLASLFAMNRVPQDRVEIFYAESASVVDHLITDNLRTNYGRFLRNLKNGLEAETALIQAYQWKYKGGIPDLEKRWITFVGRRY